MLFFCWCCVSSSTPIYWLERFDLRCVCVCVCVFVKRRVLFVCFLKPWWIAVLLFVSWNDERILCFKNEEVCGVYKCRKKGDELGLSRAMIVTCSSWRNKNNSSNDRKWHECHWSGKVLLIKILNIMFNYVFNDIKKNIIEVKNTVWFWFY